MRTLLLSALLSIGIGCTGIISAFAMVGPGIINTAAANFSPRVWQVTHQCRAVTKCDKDGNNCQTFDSCH
jgi:hypothetical protein